MSKLMQEIEQCLVREETDPQGGLSAQFLFPKTFSGFQGHFPGNPVLPGVCLLQAALVMAKAWAHDPVVLKSIASAKWFAPVGPDCTLLFTGRIEASGQDEATLKARIACQNAKVAELTLKVVCPKVEKGAAP
ncbi:MAG: hypothetical protein V2A34_07825 [Lentisphaerota bacterium]